MCGLFIISSAAVALDLSATPSVAWYHSWAPFFVFVPIFTLVLLFNLVCARFVAARDFNRHPTAQLPQRLTLLAEGIRYESDRGVFTLLWKDVINWRANGKLILALPFTTAVPDLSRAARHGGLSDGSIEGKADGGTWPGKRLSCADAARIQRVCKWRTALLFVDNHCPTDWLNRREYRGDFMLPIARCPISFIGHSRARAPNRHSRGEDNPGRLPMIEKQISRRGAFSLLGLAAALGFGVPTTMLTMSDAEAQAQPTAPASPAPATSAPAPSAPAPSTSTSGMNRRQSRRAGRHERREARRNARHQRREARRHAREMRRQARRGNSMFMKSNTTKPQ